MPVQQIPSKILNIYELDSSHAKFLSETGNEENVKNFIVRPILEALGYNSPSRIDFEYKIDLARADVALLVNSKPKVIVEIKSTNKNLDNYLSQAFKYAMIFNVNILF